MNYYINFLRQSSSLEVDSRSASEVLPTVTEHGRFITVFMRALHWTLEYIACHCAQFV